MKVSLSWGISTTPGWF